MTSKLGSGHFGVSIQNHNGWRLFDKNIFDKYDIYYTDTNSCIIKEVVWATTIFPKALRCCLELGGDCRFEFCPVFATVDRGLPGWTLWF